MSLCDGSRLELPIAAHGCIFDLLPVPLCAPSEAIGAR